MVEAKDLIYDRPGSAKIVKCVDCGHHYQNPRPTRDTIGACYTSEYGPHTHELKSAPVADAYAKAAGRNPWHLSPFVRAIPGLRSLYHWLSAGSEASLPKPPAKNSKVLEIGCGSGGYLQTLLNVGWQAEGIEFADGPAERCRQLGFQVHTTGIEDADLIPQSYDLVVAWMVIEHLHDPGSVLRQIADLLKNDGTLMFSVPNVGCWELKTFGRYNFILNEPTHLQHFSVDSIRRLLAANGFQIISVEYQNNVYNIVGSIGIWLRSRFPRRKLGYRILRFCDNPTMWGRLMLSPLAKFLQVIKQSGRITIVAKPIRRELKDQTPLSQPNPAISVKR